MDDLGTFQGGDEGMTLRYERFYPRPIATVWAALTQPERLADWIGQALVEPHVGGQFELFTDRKRPMTGRIMTWQPPSLLEFSWDTGDAPPSIVRCALVEDNGITRLVFSHRGVGIVWIGLVLPGWHAHLEWLGKALATGQAQTFDMARWRDLQAVYVARYRLEGAMLDPPEGHCD